MDLEVYDAQNDKDFLGEVSDTLSVLSVVVGNIRAEAVDADAGAKRLLAECGNLQRICASADQPFIDQTVRRLHRYIDFMNQVTDQRLTDIEQFIDVLTGILDGEIDVSGSEAEFVRSLPVLRPLDIEDLAHLDQEILLVERQRTSAKMFERELRNCGYRVNIALSPFDALEQAVRTVPDMVISSSELDGISGVDLCLALGAMSATENIPFALLSSYARSNAALVRLPERAALIRKGPQFGEDLSVALERFGLT